MGSGRALHPPSCVTVANNVRCYLSASPAGRSGSGSWPRGEATVLAAEEEETRGSQSCSRPRWGRCGAVGRIGNRGRGVVFLVYRDGGAWVF